MLDSRQGNRSTLVHTVASMDGTRDCDCDCVALIDSMDGSVGASTSGSFTYPPFYSFPPHFTLQPVRETRDKQSALWGALILDYCRHHKVGSIPLNLP